MDLRSPWVGICFALVATIIVEVIVCVIGSMRELRRREQATGGWGGQGRKAKRQDFGANFGWEFAKKYRSQFAFLAVVLYISYMFVVERFAPP